jgi:peptidoglycan/xylan/chitin deacetylase (PgdA/CDA1 family)
MKQAVLNLMRATGVFAPFRFANRNKLIVVTYHRFSETGDGWMTSAREFEKHLDYLTSRYQIVTLSSVAEHLATGKSLPAGAAVITIDDGYRDTYEIAYPILRRRGLTATLFVVTNFLDNKCWLWTDKLRYLMVRTELDTVEARVGGRSCHIELSDRSSRLRAAEQVNYQLKAMPDDAKDGAIKRLASLLKVELPALPPPEFSAINWEEVREMESAGIEIGSHTVTHPLLTNIGIERLRRELTESRNRLEDVLDHRVDLFCYPNGNSSAAVVQEVERAGYRCAVTTDPGFNDDRSNPLTLRRFGTESDLAHFVQSTSGFEQIKNRLSLSRINHQASRA